jgi:hypothetical protein
MLATPVPDGILALVMVAAASFKATKRLNAIQGLRGALCMLQIVVSSNPAMLSNNYAR